MTSEETFKISAALKDIIGKELITDEFVAVFELVKNSFDANATKVQVIFESNYEVDKSKIIIKDNGKGMNYQDLKNKWLFVAYSAKRTGKENEDYRDKIKTQRVFAGAKGVGRFSCDRLGRFLNLISIKSEPNNKIENLFVNWEDFENADEEEFVNIKVNHKELDENKYQIKNGTILEISGLRDMWDRDRILKLKKSLAKLINPNQGNDSEKFDIEIIASDEITIDNEKKSEIDIVNGIIKNSIFETLEIKTSNILVQISPKGDYIETTLQDRGDLIYYLKEKNPFQNLQNLSVYLFQLNRAAKANFTRQMGVEPVKYGSVFMYKNGFRVYPFGEEGEDLLLIDRRKAQGYNRFLGNRDLIGRIEINGEQPELKETTTRDGGLIKTKTYYELVEFFYEYVLKRLEYYVVNIIQWGDERVNKETGEVRPELWAKDAKVQILELISGFINSKNIIDIQYDKNFLEIIKEKQNQSVDKIVKNISRVANKSGNPEMIKEAKKIEKAVKEIKADADKDKTRVALVEKELDFKEEELRYVIGQNNFIQDSVKADTKEFQSLLHHTEKSTYWINKHLDNLMKKIQEGADKKTLFDLISSISLENQKIFTFTKYHKSTKFNTFVEKITQDIVSFTNEYINNVCKYYDEYDNLSIIINTPAKLGFNMEFAPIEIPIIIDNILNNSKKAKANQVTLEWTEISSDTIQLHIFDNGNGIESKYLDKIFEFRFSTTKGSGLGLYHVQKVLSNMKGEIKVNSTSNQGTEFIITFKK